MTFSTEPPAVQKYLTEANQLPIQMVFYVYRIATLGWPTSETACHSKNHIGTLLAKASVMMLGTRAKKKHYGLADKGFIGLVL